MRITILSILISLASLANAQLTLTKANNEPVVGDQRGVISLDTSFYTTGLPTNITGTNVTWDFSNLAVNSTVGVVSSDFIAPASATTSAPAGATIAEDQSGSYTFFKSSSSPIDKYEILSIKMGTVAFSFTTNPATVAEWPISYGYNVTDAVAGNVQFSISANVTGSTTTMADGTGTLMMPQGHTFTNVLRLKTVLNMNATIGPFPVGNIKQTIYQYFAAGDKFPILTVNNTATTFSSQTTNATTANGNANHLAIGIKENKLNTVSFVVLPNPANTSVSIELEKNAIAESLKLINVAGQEVKQANNSNTLSVADVPNGIYYLEVSSNDHMARKPVVINH